MFPSATSTCFLNTDHLFNEDFFPNISINLLWHLGALWSTCITCRIFKNIQSDYNHQLMTRIRVWCISCKIYVCAVSIFGARSLIWDACGHQELARGTHPEWKNCCWFMADQPPTKHRRGECRYQGLVVQGGAEGSCPGYSQQWVLSRLA